MSIEAELAKLAAEIPQEAWDALPTDLTDRLDHYLSLSITGRQVMLRKIMARRLDRKLTRAVELGVMSREEADEIRRDARGMEWLVLIEIIMAIIEMIREWLDNRNRETSPI